MKNIMKMVCLCNILLLILTGCNSNQISRPIGSYEEQVTATITRIDKSSWFMKTRHYQVCMWVTDDKYGATKMYQSYASGLLYLPEYWNYKKGDKITVTVCVEYYIDTNEIRRIYII